jgi:hypothetical protein
MAVEAILSGQVVLDQLQQQSLPALELQPPAIAPSPQEQQLHDVLRDGYIMSRGLYPSLLLSFPFCTLCCSLCAELHVCCCVSSSPYPPPISLSLLRCADLCDPVLREINRELVRRLFLMCKSVTSCLGSRLVWSSGAAAC